MLREDLARANKEAYRARRKNLIIIFGLGLLVLVFISGVSLTTSPSISKQDLPVQAVTLSGADAPVGSDNNYRDNFIELLQIYEEVTEPRLIGLNWQLIEYGLKEELLELKKSALKQFSSANYVEAVNTLRKARSKAENILQEQDNLFDVSLKKAKEFFAEFSYSKSKLHINQALALKPDDALAKMLHERIETLPLVTELFEEMKVALVENNTAKEIELIRKILKVDPKRLELLPQLKRLEKSENDLIFSAYIEKGIRHIKKGELNKARSRYKAAKEVRSVSEELNLLEGLINKYEKKVSLTSALKKSLAALNNENWAGLVLITDQALKEHLKNDVLLSRNALAKDMLRQITVLSNFIRKHERLSSNKVYLRAEQAIKASITYSERSELLLKKVMRLSELLLAYKTKVSVTIVSDNRTSISIKGLGKVGYSKYKVLQLYPNSYTIEGKRRGFRSVIVEAKVPAGIKSITFDVICDERI